MGSFVEPFDWIGDTSYSLRSKRFVVTGGSGSFGRAIIKELKREGVRSIRKLKFGTDWGHYSFESVLPVLSESDVLIFAHGTKGPDAMELNCYAAV
jgi:5,10-methylene-tetrahydrofolate dehydrogenase/methenyl tetrahydrofolate cyclohydrolase